MIIGLLAPLVSAGQGSGGDSALLRRLALIQSQLREQNSFNADNKAFVLSRLNSPTLAPDHFQILMVPLIQAARRKHYPKKDLLDLIEMKVYQDPALAFDCALDYYLAIAPFQLPSSPNIALKYEKRLLAKRRNPHSFDSEERDYISRILSMSSGADNRQAAWLFLRKDSLEEASQRWADAQLESQAKKSVEPMKAYWHFVKRVLDRRTQQHSNR